MPYCIVSVAVSIMLSQNRESLFEEPKIFYHPYAHQVFAIVAGFLLVFRSQLAYVRFWEGRTQLSLMQAKWSDAAAQAVIFDDADGEPSVKQEVYRLRMVHLFSLMHALAIQCLRKEYGNSGLVEAREELAPPVVENRDYRKRSLSLNTVTRKMMLLEDPQHRSIEQNSLEVLMGITDDEKRLLWDVAAAPGAGPQPGKEPVDQVFRVQCWVMREVGRRQREGGLKVPPPVLSRLYQVLSDGHHGFMQAKKVSYTPFPLPYAQLVLFFLIVLMFSSPFVIVAYVDSTLVAALLSFCASLGYFALNEVGRELEDPFRHDPNDLPLSELHYDFNVRLVSLVHMGMRQNGVNHINHQYLEEGPVRDQFMRSFTGSVTDKTTVRRGVQLSDDMLGTMQGDLHRSLSQLSCKSQGNVTIDDAASMELDMAQAVVSPRSVMKIVNSEAESDDMPLSPRVHASDPGDVRAPGDWAPSKN